MSEKRRDHRGRILHNGEIQLSDGRYRFKYVDEMGKERCVYMQAKILMSFPWILFMVFLLPTDDIEFYMVNTGWCVPVGKRGFSGEKSEQKIYLGQICGRLAAGRGLLQRHSLYRLPRGLLFSDESV